MKGIEHEYARAFSTPAGMAVLRHLRRITIDRPIGANASDADLRWGAAQRALVFQIEALVQKGNANE